MQHRGKRSQQAKNKRFKRWHPQKDEDPWHKLKRETVDLPRGIVLNFSQRDLENGEIIYTAQFEGVVNQKLAEYYSDKNDIPDWLLKHEFGDVLNRFPLRPFSRRGFQR